MFNSHVLHHRFPALAAAVFASLALAFVAIAGTTCSFLSVEAYEGRFVEPTTGVEQEAIMSTSFGVLCETYYFDSEGDSMWMISQIFLYISLALGGLSAALAWIVTWFVPPTLRTWRLLSVISALAAVLNIPIFLLFESEPCVIDNSRQKCVLSFGSFLLMSGTISSIAVVLLTQCIDVPSWGRELDAWKVGKREREALRLSRGIVASDEYGSDYQHSERNPPDDDADAVQAVASVGMVEGFRRWRQRQKWARSSDLQNATSPSSQDDEEGMPFAGAGSYYANSSNSRLLLKVTPEGKRPGDEQESMASFGDLDEYVKMVEEGKLDTTTSTESLDEYLAQESKDADASNDAPLLLLSQDESEPKTMSTATDDGLEKFSDEPQFYSEMKPPPSIHEDRGLLENTGNDSDSVEDDTNARESKLSRGIRSLTSRVVQDTKRRTKSGRTYTMMDDDDASAISSPPTNRPEDGETNTGRDSVTEDGSTRRARSPLDTDHLHHQTLLFDWNALHAAANAGILLAREDSRSESSDEDEPVQVTYTSDSSFGPGRGSNSSLGNLPDDEADDNSAFSASSISDISDKEEDREIVVGEGVAVKKDRKSSSRRSPRKLRRDYSSANSISSYTSVLDMTIDEETDLDLAEFESSEDDKDRVHSGGYKSAPETIGVDRKLSPYAFIQSESLPTSGERGYIVPKTKHIDTSRSVDSSNEQGLVTPDASTSQTTAGMYSGGVDERDRSAYHSDGSVARHRKVSVTAEEEDESNLCFRRSRSMSLPRRRKGASIHPLVTPPLSPTSPEDNTVLSWREERLYKGGIHSSSTPIVSDSETSEERYMSEASAKSNMSRRARKARIRRLQSENNTKRQRSRTLDPPKSRRRYDRQSGYHLTESHNATMNRLLFGSDHGPDERSL